MPFLPEASDSIIPRIAKPDFPTEEQIQDLANILTRRFFVLTEWAAFVEKITDASKMKREIIEDRFKEYLLRFYAKTCGRSVDDMASSIGVFVEQFFYCDGIFGNINNLKLVIPEAVHTLRSSLGLYGFGSSNPSIPSGTSYVDDIVVISDEIVVDICASRDQFKK